VVVIALADTAKLLASLELKDQFSPTVNKALGGLGKLEGRFGKIGGIAQKGVGNAIRNIERLGVVAGVALTAAITAGVRSLGVLQRTNAQTAAVIESTGGKAGVTAAQVRDYAEALEEVTTADDKAIQSAENLLLTFTGIGSTVFPQATKAVVDLGIAMAGGDIANADFKSSAIQIGKALNDPIKGVGALSRVGVSFTEQQKKQIKVLVKSGDVMGAQKIILKELETEFGKAGAAAGTGPEAAWRRLQDAGEDLSMALATGVLPALEKVARWLSTKLRDPGTVRFVQQLGTEIGKAADAALKFVEGIDWGPVIAGAKSVVDIARGVAGAFLALPDWVKTAVITGWGLNKLTGGALGGIVGELGKGLIRGVLGINAGVVNINAGVVNGVGGVPAAGAGKFGFVGTALKVAVIGAVAVAGLEAGIDLAGLNDPRHRTSTGQVFRGTNVPSEQLENQRRVLERLLERANQGDTYAQRQIAGVKAEITRLEGVVAGTTAASRDTKQAVTDAAAYAAHQADSWGNKYLAKLDTIRKATEANKPLSPLAPAVLKGVREPRKLQSSAAIIEIMGLEPGDLTAVAKIIRDLAVLEKTGTKSPAKIRPLLADMGKLLDEALKTGNQPLQDALLAGIKDLETSTGVHLKGLDAKLAVLSTVNATLGGVKDAVGAVVSAVGRLKFPAPRVDVRFGNPINRTTVNVTIGARTVTRAISSGGGYGPAFVYSGASLYETNP